MRLITFFCLLVTYHLAAAQNINEEIVTFKGKVRSIRYNAYDAVIINDSITPKKRVGKYTDDIQVNFDKKGQKTDQIYYINGEVYFKYVYQYDKKGNPIKMSIYSKNATTAKDWTIYDYNNLGQNKKDIFYFNGNEKEKNEYAYDSKGNLVCIKSYMWGNLDLIISYTFNDSGKKTESKTTYVKLNNATETTLFTYNKKGSLIEEKKTNSKGETEIFTSNTYDSLDRLIETKTLLKDSTIGNWNKFEYNVYNHIIKQISYYEEEPIERIHTLEYDYDKKGNWTQIITFYNGEPYEIETRTINYK